MSRTHMCSPGDELYIKLHSGVEYRGKVIAADRDCVMFEYDGYAMIMADSDIKLIGVKLRPTNDELAEALAKDRRKLFASEAISPGSAEYRVKL